MASALAHANANVLMRLAPKARMSTASNGAIAIVQVVLSLCTGNRALAAVHVGASNAARARTFDHA